MRAPRRVVLSILSAGALLLGLLPVAPPAYVVATFVVNSTGDEPDTSTADGVCDVDPSPVVTRCTPRAAIQQANATANAGGPDRINFTILPVGNACNATLVCTISPGSALPTITQAVVIDGYTQPGAAPNTAPAPQPLNTVLKIELSGANATGGFVSGLEVAGFGGAAALDGSAIRGLAINRFSGDGIAVTFARDIVIAGNFLGTDVASGIALGNAGGIRFLQSGGVLGAPRPRRATSSRATVLRASARTSRHLGSRATSSAPTPPEPAPSATAREVCRSLTASALRSAGPGRGPAMRSPSTRGWASGSPPTSLYPPEGSRSAATRSSRMGALGSISFPLVLGA